jgi:hypothetical protein
MALVLDAGALIAFDRGDRAVAALVAVAVRRGEPAVTSSAAVAQAWCGGGPRQARLARLLSGVEERPLGPPMSRLVGNLCGAVGTDDVADAHLALLATHGDVVVTGDPDDLGPLLRAIGTRAEVRRC